MNRRSILKALFLGTPTSPLSVGSEQKIAGSNVKDLGISDKRWHVLSDRDGCQQLLPGNPAMNWQIENNELICTAYLPDSTAWLSDYGLSRDGKSFKGEMEFTFNNELIGSHDLRFGFRISTTGNAGEVAQPIDAGLSSNGTLFIGGDTGDKLLKDNLLKGHLRLALSVITQSSGGCFAKLRAFDRSGNTLAVLSSTKYTSSEWQGNIGVFSQFSGTNIFDQPSVVISNFKIDGDKLVKLKLQD